MKQRWKKIASLMLVTICAFSLTACGKKEETAAYQQITEENIFDFMVDCINTVISSIFHKISHKYLFSVAEYLF